MGEIETGATSPLEGVRVLVLGGQRAAGMASVLFADQGADVIEIVGPGEEDGPENALIQRGKRLIELDDGTVEGRRMAAELASECDIVFDGWGEGRTTKAGLDYAGVAAANPSVVYVSTPGFAKGSPRRADHPWEGAVCAAVGVYTDIHLWGPVLGGDPTFTAIPMASAYGSVHAAIAASMGYLHRLKTGEGQYIEVPLADAVMSAMALLAMEVEGQPQRFDLPPIDKVMRETALPILRDLSDQLTPEHRASLLVYLSKFSWPSFSTYKCADDRLIFINAIEHVHHARACLDVLGILDELLGEGLIVGSPYDESGAGNNLNLATLSLDWRMRLRNRLSERFLTRPPADWEADLGRAGVPSSVVRTSTEWLRLTSAAEGGNVAMLEDPVWGRTNQAGRFVSIEGNECRSSALRPRQRVTEARWAGPRIEPSRRKQASEAAAILPDLRVLDLSNVIAGPAGGRVFAEFGADVVRIDAPAPSGGPRMTMWFGIDVNRGKRALILDLKAPEGRAAFAKMTGQADVVLHNFLDASAARMGIGPEELRTLKPDLVTCQISAWGGPSGGPRKDFPSFDPVLQYATGISARYGDVDAPVLHGVASCVDYLTGFLAACGIAQALIARELGRGGAHVRTSLSMGAQYVQFPFMVDAPGHVPSEPSGQATKGYGAHQALYRCADGWIFLGFRKEALPRVAAAIGAKDDNYDDIARAIEKLDAVDLRALLAQVPSASVVPVTRLDELRAATLWTGEAPTFSDLDGPSIAMARAPHPSGYDVTLPLPTWYRFARTPVRQLEAAPFPGADRASVLQSYGFDAEEIGELSLRGATRDGWAVLKRYLPL